MSQEVSLIEDDTGEYTYFNKEVLKDISPKNMIKLALNGSGSEFKIEEEDRCHFVYQVFDEWIHKKRQPQKVEKVFKYLKLNRLEKSKENMAVTLSMLIATNNDRSPQNQRTEFILFFIDQFKNSLSSPLKDQLKNLIRSNHVF